MSSKATIFFCFSSSTRRDADGFGKKKTSRKDKPGVALYLFAAQRFFESLRKTVQPLVFTRIIVAKNAPSPTCSSRMLSPCLLKIPG